MRVALISMGMALALVFAAGCSDDDNGGQKDTGVADAVGSDAVGSDAVGSDAVGSDAVGSDGSGGGSCNNAADKAAVTKTWNGKNLREVIAAQTLCLAKPTPKEKEDCLVNEVAKAINNDVSNACLRCYAKSALCTATYCLTAPANCLTNPNGAECIKCQCGTNSASKNCIAEFTSCAGIPASVTCP